PLADRCQVCEAVRASLAAGGVLAQYSPVPNHVLVNHYRPGEGIMPHTDGPAYEPAAAILSLGSATVFEFWRDHAHVVGGEPPALALLVPPRSLLVFTEEAYSAHLHGIADRRYDEITAVANWKGPSSWARWAPSPWAARQLEPAAASEVRGPASEGALVAHHPPRGACSARASVGRPSASGLSAPGFGLGRPAGRCEKPGTSLLLPTSIVKGQGAERRTALGSEGARRSSGHSVVVPPALLVHPGALGTKKGLRSLAFLPVVPRL
ncbi:unnamed protein product, partial [Prorocentrum cordatum]